MIIEQCIQGSDDWQRVRLGVVTASNFGKVLAGGSGKTRLRYMRTLTDEIIYGRKADGFWSHAMERGTELEPIARQAYEQQTGSWVREIGFTFLSERRRIGGSPDGLIDHDGGLEIKCPLPDTHKKYMRTGTIPAAYMAQIQGNLWITGRSWWDFVSFTPEEPLLVKRVYRSEPYIRMLSDKVSSFVRDLDDLVEQTRGFNAHKAAG